MENLRKMLSAHQELCGQDAVSRHDLQASARGIVREAEALQLGYENAMKSTAALGGVIRAENGVMKAQLKERAKTIGSLQAEVNDKLKALAQEMRKRQDEQKAATSFAYTQGTTITQLRAQLKEEDAARAQEAKAREQAEQEHHRQMETLTTKLSQATESEEALRKEYDALLQDKDAVAKSLAAAQGKLNKAEVVVAAGPEAGSITLSHVLSTETLKPGMIVRLQSKQWVEIKELKVEDGKCTLKGFLLVETKTVMAQFGVATLINHATGLPIAADTIGKYLLTDTAVEVVIEAIPTVATRLDTLVYRLVGDSFMIASPPGKWSLEMAERVRAPPLADEAVQLLNRSGPMYARHQDIVEKSVGVELPKLEVRSEEENAGGKKCSMCHKTIKAEEPFFEDQGATIQCCLKCLPLYLRLKAAHDAMPQVRSQGLPLKPELAADFEQKVLKLHALTFPTNAKPKKRAKTA